MSELRRKRGARASAKYPDAKEFFRRRREFLALVTKGALGASMFGLIGCDSDGKPYEIAGGLKAPDTIDTIGDDVPVPGGIRAPDVVDVEETYYTDGVIVPPKEVSSGETHSWDTAGVMPDVVDKDSCTVPTDVEGDFAPLPGEAPMPDTIDVEE